jgi:hypothetical protein
MANDLTRPSERWSVAMPLRLFAKMKSKVEPVSSREILSHSLYAKAQPDKRYILYRNYLNCHTSCGICQTRWTGLSMTLPAVSLENG